MISTGGIFTHSVGVWLRCDLNDDAEATDEADDKHDGGAAKLVIPRVMMVRENCTTCSLDTLDLTCSLPSTAIGGVVGLVKFSSIVESKVEKAPRNVHRRFDLMQRERERERVNKRREVSLSW